MRQGSLPFFAKEHAHGRTQPAASDVFDAGGRAIPSAISLWPGLLAMAIALNVAELVNRKWRGLVDLFRRQ